MSKKWSYGVTTVPSRKDDLLPRTLRSLAAAGFETPRLFIDGSDGQEFKHFGLPMTCRDTNVRTHGNWVLSMYELFIREPEADFYALFQDDLITYKNLRQYLEGCRYPCLENGLPPGYWNLYTFPSNQRLCPDNQIGWYKSNQYGRGAVGLVFKRDILLVLLGARHLLERPMDQHRGFRSVDGGIVTAMQKADYTEYVHNPSLLQHIGEVSSMKNRPHPRAESFRGEEFDALCLVTS